MSPAPPRGRISGAVVSAFLLAAYLPSQLAATPLVQTFFVPLPEAQAQAALTKIYSGVNSTMHSVTSIASTQPGTIIHYDQWENGYENDLANPLSIYND